MKESGSRRTPVSIAESPSAIERKSGIAKNMPALEEVLEEERGEARAQDRDPQDRRVDERLALALDEAVLPPEEERQHGGAAEHQPDHRREPDPFGRVGLGLDEAPGPGAQDAEHDQPEAEGREPGPDQVQLHLPLRLAGLDAAGEDEDRDHDQDLAGEDVAPGEVGGEEAADDRADRDRDRRGGGDQAVGAGPFGAAEVGGDEGDDRGQDQRRPEALQAATSRSAAPAGSGASAVVSEPQP